MTSAPTLEHRILGCLMGGAVGDALGAGVEFLSLDQIRREQGPLGVSGYVPAYGGLGRVTDDTQMAVITVEAISRALDSGQPVNEVAHQLYRDWAEAQVAGRWSSDADPWLVERTLLLAQRAPGNACLSGLTVGFMATLDNRVNANSKGCGTVMRSAPFGLVPAWSPEEVFHHAAQGSVLSHGDDTALAAAGALAMIVRRLLDDVVLLDAVEETLEYLDSITGLDAFETMEALGQALDAAVLMEPSPEAVEALGGGWTAEEALAIGVYCALVFEPDMEAALLLAVNHSGDSDSVGALTGNLLGAAHGTAGRAEWVAANEAVGIVHECVESLLLALVVPGG